MEGETRRLTLAEAERLAAGALEAAGASPDQAAPTARALTAAEADGQSGHGLGRVPAYAAQVRRGKVRGDAEPRVEAERPAAARIDAAGGFAYPALDLAESILGRLAPAAGVAAVTVRRSHHIGQAGQAAERLAERGLVALVVSNTPAAMAFWGGRRPAMGTNPLAFAAPLPGRAPLLIDLALTLVARSKVAAAAKAGRPIPDDWAFDAEGRPTTDPAAALKGALAPAGGAKGAALALMVEILCGALAGGRFGWEASSFLDAEGDPPGVGQTLLALDPGAFGEGFLDRMGSLAAEVEAEAGARLPGDRRLALREAAAREGLRVPAGLAAELEALAHVA